MRRLTLAVVLTGLAGCYAKPTPPPPLMPPKVPAPAPVPAPPQDASAPVELKIVKWPELEKSLADLKGKVVLLDIWAEY